MNSAAGNGRQNPPLIVGPISAQTVAQFAHAQRDPNPIHVSAEAAQAVGFSGPIVHGMFILGQFERLLRSWKAFEILALDARFIRPVPVETVLVFSGRPLRKAGDELLWRLIAKDESGSLVAIGEAKLRMAPL